MSNKTAIHFGAGNIGRGFIGPLLAQSSYHVIFADVNKELIDDIKEHKTYKVYVLEGKNPRGVPVKDVNGILSTNGDIVEAIAEPEVQIITTSVGAGVLPKIAPTLARGIQQRRKARGGPINVIACENAVGATTQLAKATDEHFSDEDRAYVAENVGFANCSVDRIVPPFENDSALSVGVEGFHEWIVEKGPLKNLDDEGSLGIKGITLTTDLEAYVERKLFTLNTGHATAAYLGALHGHETIYESMGDDEILKTVRGAMQESGAALLKKHPALRKEDHDGYIQKIENRFKNKHINDHVGRVGREPLRKLGKGDRLVFPAVLATEYGLPIDNLARAIAAALLYVNEEDEQAVELQKKIREQGIERVIVEITGFAEESQQSRKVFQTYQELSGRRRGPH